MPELEKGLRKRAIILFSGGLDSILAARLMMEQGFELLALNFTSPFFGHPKANPERPNAAQKAAQELGIEYRILDVGLEFIDVVRNPRYGHGKNMNPCIDCRIEMLNRAGEIMENEGYSFIVTGEVLGQRPKSQRRDAMHIVERDSGLKGRLLRPLCAQLLEPTIPEKEGTVDRERLLAVSGRSRKQQMSLAVKWNIGDYPSPAGGCLLTDPGYSRRLRHLFETKKDLAPEDVELLSVGRHLRLGERNKAIVSRNEKENKHLEDLWPDGALLFVPANFPGPVALAIGHIKPEEKMLVARMILRYGKPPKEGDAAVLCRDQSSQEEIRVDSALENNEIEKIHI